MSNGQGSNGLGSLRWKNLSNNGLSLSASANTSVPGSGQTPSSSKKHCKSDQEKQSNRTKYEENTNLAQALARIEELSQENDLLRAKLEQCEQGHMLYAHQEEMERKMQKVLKLTKDKESSYERQITNLKEEVIHLHTVVQVQHLVSV